MVVGDVLTTTRSPFHTSSRPSFVADFERVSCPCAYDNLRNQFSSITPRTSRWLPASESFERLVCVFCRSVRQPSRGACTGGCWQTRLRHKSFNIGHRYRCFTGGKLDAADPSRWGQDAIAKNVNSTRLAIVHRLTAGLVWPSVG